MNCPNCVDTHGLPIEMEAKIDPESGGCAVCPNCKLVIDCEDSEAW